MQDSLGSTWAKIIIEQLIEDQHDFFCISPGSRSTPLVLAIDANSQAKTFIHFDERSLAFHALGYSKIALNAPVVVVTSGTACGNLLPAVMESYESSTPLIILTADRPFDLQDSGANQTTKHQLSLYKNFVCYELALPTPDISYLENLRHLIHRASYLTKKHKKSVHINCCFKEPFNLDSSKTPKFFSSPCLSYLFEKKIPTETVQQIANCINQAKKGAFLLGADAAKHPENSSLALLADLLQWPIFADPLALWDSHACDIAHYNKIFKQLTSTSSELADLKFDCILHFGGSFVSKHLLNFLKNTQPTTYIHIHAFDQRFDPGHLVTHKLEIEPGVFAQALLPFVQKPEKPSLWFALAEHIKNTIDHFFSKVQSNSEAYFFWKLSQTITCDSLFIGNSMPIRDLTDFFTKSSISTKIYCNRGLSGIDGNIATAAGLCFAMQKPLWAILGDQTFLHDATSLAHLSALQNPLTLIILNNRGGQIFSHLPIHHLGKTCEKYFINPHSVHIQRIAQAFNIPYLFYKSVDQFFLGQENFHNTSCLIEIETSSTSNLEVHRLVSLEMEDALSAFVCKI